MSLFWMRIRRLQITPPLVLSERMMLRNLEGMRGATALQFHEDPIQVHENAVKRACGNSMSACFSHIVVVPPKEYKSFFQTVEQQRRRHRVVLPL